jgi:hypothetical protein
LVVESIAARLALATALVWRLEQGLTLRALHRPRPGAAHDVGVVAEGLLLPILVQVGRLPHLGGTAFVPAGSARMGEFALGKAVRM